MIGWPDAEVNLGKLAGISEANLRADIFIRFSERQAVVVEWQSEIHTEEGCKSNWFNYDDIAGRDDLKRQICAKIGVGLIELWTLDITDKRLSSLIMKQVDGIYISDTAVAALDKEYHPFGVSKTTFGVAEVGFKTPEESFKPSDFGSSNSGFGRGAGFKSGKFGKSDRGFK